MRITTLVVLLAIMGVLLYFYLEKRKKDREAEEFNQKNRTAARVEEPYRLSRTGCIIEVVSLAQFADG